MALQQEEVNIIDVYDEPVILITLEISHPVNVNVARYITLSAYDTAYFLSDWFEHFLDR